MLPSGALLACHTNEIPRSIQLSLLVITRTAVLAALCMVTFAGYCFSQDLDDFSDLTLTHEQWQKRVEESRRQSQEFVANARVQKSLAPTDKEESEAADERALNDPTLQQGDIISTSKGFVVFVGRHEQHRPDDFRPAPDWHWPPESKSRRVLPPQ